MMFCVNCAFNIVDELAKFCPKCGKSQIANLPNSFCQKCGNKLETENGSCKNCERKMESNPDLNKEKPIPQKPRLRSPFWYLLPIIFAIFGGIVMFVALRKSDFKKAKRGIIVGLIFTIPMILSLFFSGTNDSSFVIASGSMVPTLEIYDIVSVDRNFPFDEIQVGDIIVFNRPSDHERIISHRVVEKLYDEPTTLRTKGDVNPSSIPGTDFPITEEEYIGKVVNVIPQFGIVTQLLKPPINYIIQGIVIGVTLGVLTIKHLKFKKNSRENSGKDDYDS